MDKGVFIIKRKITWSLMVCAVLGLFLLASTAPVAAQTFTDIDGHWAKQEIIKLSDGGYIKGYGNNTFCPDRTMSRAEFLTVLMNIKGLKASTSSTNSFSDLKGHWARGLINEAVRQGIVVKSEYSGIFKPDQALKRSEATGMMVRALGKAPNSGAITFTDKANVEKSLYRGYIKAAYDLGLISSFPDGSFKPFDLVTRAQACTMLNHFAEKAGGTNPTPVTEGSLSKIVIAGNTFDFTTTPVYIKIGLNEVRITSLSATGNSIFVNNTYLYSLTSGTNYPDVIVNNIRYIVSKLSVSGSNLVVVPDSMRLNRLAIDDLRYDPEFVELYVGKVNSDYYLYDMEIVDQYTVKVDTEEIDLRDDSITIAPGDQFYTVNKVVFGTTDTSLKLDETDPVVFDKLTLSDINDIYVGKNRYDMDDITRLNFIIGEENYALNQITIDASGNFTVDRKTYTPSQVMMIIDGEYYTIDDVRVYEEKFTLYCKSADFSKVRINDQYYDVSEVRILKDGTPYDLDSIVVVREDLIRIGGKQYELDSSFDCRFNGKVHDIKEIDYDDTLNMITMEVSESSTSSSPSRYLFYCDSSLVQNDTDGVTIYVSRTWRDFDDVVILDPINYSYSGTTYDLIGAWLEIDGDEYEVIDTTWQGTTQQFKIYLEEM